jgi:hypothetical protein
MTAKTLREKIRHLTAQIGFRTIHSGSFYDFICFERKNIYIIIDYQVREFMLFMLEDGNAIKLVNTIKFKTHCEFWYHVSDYVQSNTYSPPNDCI